MVIGSLIKLLKTQNSSLCMCDIDNELTEGEKIRDFGGKNVTKYFLKELKRLEAPKY